MALPPAPPPVLVQPLGQPPDVWAQVATQLTQGIANIATAIQPATYSSRSDPATAYEEGGELYDIYQLSVLQGFAHIHLPTEVPKIWPTFQHTEHMDTHRDNICRQMDMWATAQPHHFGIDRGLYLPIITLREILSLQFSPGGTVSDLSSANSGMSILICCAQSMEHKAALKRRELAEDWTRST